MGFSISWLAVRGKDVGVVLRELDLVPTGERDELPAESPIGGTSLPGDWYVIVLDRYEHELVGEDVLKRVSRGCEVVAAGGEEHVMHSFGEAWHDGERVWWSRHDAQQGHYDLETAGSLPPGFDTLRRQLLEEQDAAGGNDADVDFIYSLPLDAAKSVCGFAHDEAESDEGFAVLARAAT